MKIVVIIVLIIFALLDWLLVAGCNLWEQMRGDNDDDKTISVTNQDIDHQDAEAVRQDE